MGDATELRRRLAAELGGFEQVPWNPLAITPIGSPDQQSSARPVPQPDPYRASPFAAPGAPPVQNMPHDPNSGMRDVREEMTKLPGVIDTTKLNDTPLWNKGGMSLQDVRRSHPPIAPLMEKWLREASEAYTMMMRRNGMSEKRARQKARKEFGPTAKIDGYALDPEEEVFPDEWGGDIPFDANGQRSFKTRNSDLSDMSKILRDLLEERWPGAMPEGYQEELDDLLQDHQYDQRGKRMGPTSMMDLDTLLSAVYRRRSNPVA